MTVFIIFIFLHLLPSLSFYIFLMTFNRYPCFVEPFGNFLPAHVLGIVVLVLPSLTAQILVIPGRYERMYWDARLVYIVDSTYLHIIIEMALSYAVLQYVHNSVGLCLLSSLL